MVKLVTDNPDQINALEWQLITHHIPYEIEKVDRFSIDTPYLIVDGVPLDLERSLKWIKERCYCENEH